MSTNLINTIINSLQKVATVPVEVDGVESREKITLSRLKMEQALASYEKIYNLVNKCWSNLPNPPCDESTYLFVWIIASDNYCINHNTISWDGAGANTFIHVWSIMDRIRMSLEATDLRWLIGSRNCPDYCRYVDMPGALDRFLYMPEPMLPTQISDLEKDVFAPGYTPVNKEYCSYFDFCMDSLVDSGPKVVSVSEMSMQNQEIERRMRNMNN